MKNGLHIQLKAAFLMIVFSLNTIIGFACAVGIDMGFNATHHHDEEGIEVLHVNANGEKHIHHDEATSHHHKSKDGKDNCCNDKVIQFSQLDKSIPQSQNPAINPAFFTSFISSFYDAGVIFTSLQFRSIKYFVRGHHPPIPDIRVAIKSFQI
ncbi:MAG: hypothetical protein ABI863_20100 [Ginsengibacter sp.]